MQQAHEHAPFRFQDTDRAPERHTTRGVPVICALLGTVAGNTEQTLIINPFLFDTQTLKESQFLSQNCVKSAGKKAGARTVFEALAIRPEHE